MESSSDYFVVLTQLIISTREILFDLIVGS